MAVPTTKTTPAPHGQPGQHSEYMQSNNIQPESQSENLPSEVLGIPPEISTVSKSINHCEDPPPFPLHSLPPVISEMVKEVARVFRVPDSLPAICGLGAISASIGKGLVVKSGPERVTRANLFFIGSAESGSGKSETYRLMTAPVFQHEWNLSATWEEEIRPNLEAEKKMLEVKIGDLAKDLKGESDKDSIAQIRRDLEVANSSMAQLKDDFSPPVMVTEDVTPEKLALLLQQQNESIASMSADAGSAINQILGRYSKLNGTEESIYLRAFSGDTCVVHRIGRDAVRLQSPCMAILWLTQPDKVNMLFDNQAFIDGGFLPRMIVCHTGCEPQLIAESQAEIASEVKNDYTKLFEGLIKTYRFSVEPFVIEPDSNASGLLRDHYNRIVGSWKSEYRDIVSFAMRWTEQAWRLAVCLHAATWGEDAFRNELSGETAEAAIEIADFFRHQQLDLLEVNRDADANEKKCAIEQLIREKGGELTARDVQRKRIARTAKEARDFLDDMSTLEKVDLTPPGGGRTKRIYRLKNENNRAV